MIGRAGTIFRQGTGSISSKRGGTSVNFRDQAHSPPEKKVKTNLSTLQQLTNLSLAGQSYLYKISAVFPFDLFPDQIIVDRNKVNIINRSFFNVERVHSVVIPDLADVYIDMSTFFSTLRIIDRNFVENEIKVEYLKRSEAARARRIIQGLLVTYRQGIDVTHVNKEDLLPHLEELGKAA